SAAQGNDGFVWFRNRKFALVTVTEPTAGVWKLEAPKAVKTRVTVISDLRLDVDPLPNSLPAGKRAELGLRLRQRGKILRDPEVLAVFDLTLEIENPAGEVQLIDVLADYEVPEDGEFRVLIPGLDLPGRYKITAKLKGETLNRALPMYVEIIDSPVNGSISTRANEAPEEDFRAPMFSFAAALGVIAILIYWFLARRRRRKLEVWRRRNLNQNGSTEPHSAVAGMHAPAQERDTHS
ncbi:MAG: hypothetical protein V7709_17440, partial [Halioglobus sp.]